MTDPVVTDPVAAAFQATPRVGFLWPRDQGRASYDGPILIGRGQTNSQPSTVAAMLRLLDVRPGQRVLDIGSGSGWTTALLAHLVGPDGHVLGLEVVPSLVKFGQRNLAATGRPWATIRPAEPGHLGDPAGAPYNRILVSAEPDAFPLSLLDQLAPGGVVVIPVAGVMLRATADQVTEHGRYRFVPLV